MKRSLEEIRRDVERITSVNGRSVCYLFPQDYDALTSAARSKAPPLWLLRQRSGRMFVNNIEVKVAK